MVIIKCGGEIMDDNEMYYRRIIPEELKKLLMIGGGLHWLFKLVKERDDLDFLIGINKIYVYRGTTRLLAIAFTRGIVSILADCRYRSLSQDHNLKIYGDKEIAELNFEDDFVDLISFLPPDRHYDNMKEGFFQNLFSRQFGILSDGSEDFVMVDKEAVIGYQNNKTKEKYFGKQRKQFIEIKEYLSEQNAKRYGSRLGEYTLGNELDFLAVNRSGEILLIEFKHSSSTKGIYLSPIQIGLYYSIFHDYIIRHRQEFVKDIGDMIKQKKDMGLISTNFPEVNISDKIVPMLVIAKYNPKSSALDTFRSVLKICRDKLKDDAFLSGLKVYDYDTDNRLKSLSY
jgi:hypothetical protein